MYKINVQRTCLTQEISCLIREVGRLSKQEGGSQLRSEKTALDLEVFWIYNAGHYPLC